MFFLSNPASFNGQDYEKQQGPSDQWQWSVALQVTKQVQKNSSISDVLLDQVWWCNTMQFWVIANITSANLCKPIHDIINYSTFI